MSGLGMEGYSYFPRRPMLTRQLAMDVETSAPTSRQRNSRQELVTGFLSDLHGYANFHHAKGIRKAIWGVILAAMSVFIIRLTYLSYRSENYYSQIIELDTRSYDQLEFPTVTICNIKPVYKVDMYKRIPINMTVDEFETFYYQVLSNYGNIYGYTDPVFIARVVKELASKGYRSYKDVLNLFEIHESKDIRNPLLGWMKCKYDRNLFNFTQHFRTVARFTEQSLCKQFNFYEKGKVGLRSTGTGIHKGLYMYWDITGEPYHFSFNRDLQGLLVEIHNYGTPHHLRNYKNVLYLEPGVLTNVDLEQVVHERLPPPFKPHCQHQAFKIIKDYPYSKAMCEVDCLLQKHLKKCGCVADEFSAYVGDTPVCNVTQMQCTFGVKDYECHEDTKCPSECNAVSYKVTTSRLGIGKDQMAEQIAQAMGPTYAQKRVDMNRYVKENIVAFRIGFKSHEVEIRRHKETTPWYERLSMLGGCIGLLIGFSAITVFEFFEFLFDYVYSSTPLYKAHGHSGSVHNSHQRTGSARDGTMGAMLSAT